MKRLGHAIGVSALLVVSFSHAPRAAGGFDQKLPVDRQMVQILSRLTFGARPGDLEQIRRVGAATWIDLQLHPERIAENPALSARLTPLETLRLPTWQLLEKYPAAPAALTARPASAVAFTSLLQPQLGRLLNCSVDERKATLAALDPDLRRLVLIAAPPQVLEGLPDDLKAGSGERTPGGTGGASKGDSAD